MRTSYSAERVDRAADVDYIYRLGIVRRKGKVGRLRVGIKADYAVRVLAELAAHPYGTAVTVEALADADPAPHSEGLDQGLIPSRGQFSTGRSDGFRQAIDILV